MSGGKQLKLESVTLGQDSTPSRQIRQESYLEVAFRFWAGFQAPGGRLELTSQSFTKFLDRPITTEILFLWDVEFRLSRGST